MYQVTKSIPAIGYMKAVLHFAIAKGYAHTTVKDMLIARRLYEQYAMKNN